MRTMSARSQIYHIPPAKGFNTKELSQLSVRQDLPMEARNLAIELAKFKHGTATMAAAIAELVRSPCTRFPPFLTREHCGLFETIPTVPLALA